MDLHQRHKAGAAHGAVTELEAFHVLCGYSLTHGDPAFIHQHVVDAFAAQHAVADGKPISLTFALAGLYLHLERGFTGREVQLAHMRMARRKRTWPAFVMPGDRGSVTSLDVLAVPEGPARDAAIDAWCQSVWNAFSVNRQTVIDLLAQFDIH